MPAEPLAQVLATFPATMLDDLDDGVM